MNMRPLIIIAFIFVASFGAPFVAGAADGCTNAGASCIFPEGGGSGICMYDNSIGLYCGMGGNPPAGPGNSNPPAGLGNPSAPSGPSGQNVTLINPLQGGGNLQSFLLNILAFVIRIGGIAVVLMLVYVGYLFVVARGEPGKITEARSALLWTVVGALILLGSQAIAMAIQATVQAISVGG